ncbi:MAG: response regulator transcription factor [Acidimicrobiia bacterium]|nr:response regulator transcription factor [Acidimicrobiia bacterium]
MISVLLADDHPVVLKGLSQIVSGAPGLSVAAEASNASQVLELLDQHHADVAVLDMSMPGRSGVELISDIRLRFPNLPILVLSVYPEEQMGLRCIQAGAAGYLTKEAAPDLLVEAIRKLHAGGKFVSEKLAAAMVNALQRPTGRPLHEQLSTREYSVLIAIAAGKTVSEIAAELSLSVKTISTYRARVLEKMGMRTNSELTRYAFEHSLLP